MAPSLVWAGFNGDIVIGSLTTLQQKVVAEADVDAATPLIAFGGNVYWVKQSGGFVDGAFWPRTIERLNLATGKSIAFSPGEFAFRSADQRNLYISQTDNAVAEVRPGSVAPSVTRTLPAGWYLPGGFGVAVANGIAVQSDDVPSPAQASDLAVWNPQSGRVRVVGRAVGVIGAYTPAATNYSLLAWMPANCRFPDCGISVTNTATFATRTLRSPLGYGFVLGGAFSPDGQQLAVFVNSAPSARNQTAELAIVSVATGAVRLVPAVKLTVGQDADWLRWLPEGTSLVVLADRDYLINGATLKARPFRFSGKGEDVNFSADLITHH